MLPDTQNKINIPESIEGYRITLFWGLTISQVILVFIAILLTAFGAFSLLSHKPIVATGMVILTILTLLAMIKIRGRNFYRHLLFLFSYYFKKPKVLVYHHYPTSGLSLPENTDLVYRKANHRTLFILIIFGITLGLSLLLLTIIYLYHVVHY